MKADACGSGAGSQMMLVSKLESLPRNTVLLVDTHGLYAGSGRRLFGEDHSSFVKESIVVEMQSDDFMALGSWYAWRRKGQGSSCSTTLEYK